MTVVCVFGATGGGLQAMDTRVKEHLRRNLLDSPMRKRIKLPAGVGPGDYLKIRDDVGGGAERRYEIQVVSESLSVLLRCRWTSC